MYSQTTVVADDSLSNSLLQQKLQDSLSRKKDKNYRIYRITGQVTYPHYSEPIIVEVEELQDKKVRKIVTGRSHALVLTYDGTLLVQGKNKKGQLGIEVNETTEFIQINGIKNIEDIAAADRYSVAINNVGKIFVWGEIPFLRKTRGNITHPTELTGIDSPVVKIFATPCAITFLCKDKKVYVIGTNAYGSMQSRDPNCRGYSEPTRAEMLEEITEPFSLREGCFAPTVLTKEHAYIVHGDSTGDFVTSAKKLEIKCLAGLGLNAQVEAVHSSWPIGKTVWWLDNGNLFQAPLMHFFADANGKFEDEEEAKDWDKTYPVFIDIVQDTTNKKPIKNNPTAHREPLKILSSFASSDVPQTLVVVSQSNIVYLVDADVIGSDDESISGDDYVQAWSTTQVGGLPENAIVDKVVPNKDSAFLLVELGK
jgi:hypothetical protein